MGNAGYLALVVAILVLGVEGASVVAAVRPWRETKRPGGPRLGFTLRRVLAGTVVVIVVTSVLGAVIGSLGFFGAMPGESVDPSQRARVLGRGSRSR